MTARPMNEVIVDDFKQTLFLLIAAVVLLLLISSSNVASLLLTHRPRPGNCSAHHARRWHIDTFIRQLLWREPRSRPRRLRADVSSPT